MCGLSFFHGVCLERARYGAAGWNAPQDFDASDLSISLGQLRSMLVDVAKSAAANTKAEASLKPLLRALRYLISECNYGGRVTDEHDRRLLAVLLAHYFSKDTAFQRGRGLSETPAGTEEEDAYSVPEEPSLSECRGWSAGLPELAAPAALGLNDNAAAAADARESAALLRNALSTQPQLRFSARAEAAGDEDVTSQTMLRRVRRDLIAAVPDNLDSDAIADNFPIPGEEKVVDGETKPSSPLNSILRLEVGR